MSMNFQSVVDRFRTWTTTPAATALIPDVVSLRTVIVDPIYRDVLHDVIRSALRQTYEAPTEDGVKVSAGTVIWRQGRGPDDELEILLVHPTSAKWSGTYSIPKGAPDRGETKEETAVRETFEEIGIQLNPADLISGGVVENVDKKGRPKKRVTYFFVEAPELPSVIDKAQLQIDEVDWAGFVPVSKLPAKMIAYQQPIVAALGTHLAAVRRGRREAVASPPPTVATLEGINPHQHGVLRRLADRLSTEDFRVVGVWREPPPLGRVILSAQNEAAEAVGSWVVPDRSDAIPIPATMTPPVGAVVYPLSLVLTASAVASEVPPSRQSSTSAAPRMPSARPPSARPPSARPPSARPPSARPRRPGEPPPGWHVEAGARLEALREATTAWLAELGFVGYAAVPVVLLEIQRVGPITADWTRQVSGEDAPRVFQVVVKGRADGKLDVTSSFTFPGGKLARRKSSVVDTVDQLIPETLFPEEWLMQAAEQVAQRAVNPLERLPVERLRDGGAADGAFCPPSDDFVTTRGARRDEGPRGASEDAFTTRTKLAAWREVAEQGKAILAKHNVVLGEAIGCGRYACAFEVKGRPGLVAKLTGDPSEAAAWQLAMEAYGDPDGPSWPATLARTYCIEALPLRVPHKRRGPQKRQRFDPYAQYMTRQESRGPLRYADERRLYFVLQERLQPLPPKVKKAFTDESYDLRLAADVLPAPAHGWAGPKPSVGLKNLYEYLDKKKLDHATFDAIIDLLVDLNETAGVLFSDVHGGNFLQDATGTIKLIDLGASTVPHVDVPEMRRFEGSTETLLTPWRDRAGRAASWVSAKVADLARYNVEGMEDALQDPEFMAFLAMVFATEGASGGTATPIDMTAAIVELYRYWRRKKAREAQRGLGGPQDLEQRDLGVEAPSAIVETCPWRPGTDIKTYMLEEHEEIRELLTGVEDALRAGDATAVEHRWRQLLVDVEQHFLSEERDIFPRLHEQGFETSDLEAEHAPLLAALRERPTLKSLPRVRDALEQHAEREETRFGWR